MERNQDFTSELLEESDKEAVRELHEDYGEDFASICEKLAHLSPRAIRNYIAELEGQK